MNDLYELAKTVDVIIIFYILMGAGIYGIIYIIMNTIWLIHDSWRVRKEKKKKTTDQIEK